MRGAMNRTCFVRDARRRWGLTAGAFLAALLSGCGSGGPYPVEGRVVWKDGSPATELSGSQVVFDLPAKQTGTRGNDQPLSRLVDVQFFDVPENENLAVALREVLDTVSNLCPRFGPRHLRVRRLAPTRAGAAGEHVLFSRARKFGKEHDRASG